VTAVGAKGLDTTVKMLEGSMYSKSYLFEAGGSGEGLFRATTQPARTSLRKLPPERSIAGEFLH
jgi:hypothetical protein